VAPGELRGWGDAKLKIPLQASPTERSCSLTEFLGKLPVARAGTHFSLSCSVSLSRLVSQVSAIDASNLEFVHPLSPWNFIPTIGTIVMASNLGFGTTHDSTNLHTARYRISLIAHFRGCRSTEGCCPTWTVRHCIQCRSIQLALQTMTWARTRQVVVACPPLTVASPNAAMPRKAGSLASLLNELVKSQCPTPCATSCGRPKHLAKHQMPGQVPRADSQGRIIVVLLGPAWLLLRPCIVCKARVMILPMDGCSRE
jgi:hypothetical protein